MATGTATIASLIKAIGIPADQVDTQPANTGDRERYESGRRVARSDFFAVPLATIRSQPVIWRLGFVQGFRELTAPGAVHGVTDKGGAAMVDQGRVITTENADQFDRVDITGGLLALVRGHDGRMLGEIYDRETGITYLAVTDAAVSLTSGATAFRVAGYVAKYDRWGSVRRIMHNAQWTAV